MTSDPPFRRSRGTGGALRELRRCAGTHFDPAVVEALCAVVEAGDDGLGGARHAGAATSARCARGRAAGACRPPPAPACARPRPAPSRPAPPAAARRRPAPRLMPASISTSIAAARPADSAITAAVVASPTRFTLPRSATAAASSASSAAAARMLAGGPAAASVAASSAAAPPVARRVVVLRQPQRLDHAGVGAAVLGHQLDQLGAQLLRPRRARPPSPASRRRSARARTSGWRPSRPSPRRPPRRSRRARRRPVRARRRRAARAARRAAARAARRRPTWRPDYLPARPGGDPDGLDLQALGLTLSRPRHE